MTNDQLQAMSQLPETPLEQFVPGYKELKTSELKAMLVELNMPTTGVRSDLLLRLEDGLRHQRQRAMSWDPDTTSWVPMTTDTVADSVRRAME